MLDPSAFFMLQIFVAFRFSASDQKLGIGPGITIYQNMGLQHPCVTVHLHASVWHQYMQSWCYASAHAHADSVPLWHKIKELLVEVKILDR